MREWLIKLLGGYTEKEMLRSERKFQALLDSKGSNETVKYCNEYIYRILRDLERYLISLYGKEPNIWMSRIFNVIKNNRLRILVRYIHVGCGIPYIIDCTLDREDQFKEIIKQELESDELKSIIEA